MASSMPLLWSEFAKAIAKSKITHPKSAVIAYRTNRETEMITLKEITNQMRLNPLTHTGKTTAQAASLKHHAEQAKV